MLRHRESRRIELQQFFRLPSNRCVEVYGVNRLVEIAGLGCIIGIVKSGPYDRFRQGGGGQPVPCQFDPGLRQRQSDGDLIQPNTELPTYTNSDVPRQQQQAASRQPPAATE